jgi:hypothetical protein
MIENKNNYKLHGNNLGNDLLNKSGSGQRIGSGGPSGAL